MSTPASAELSNPFFAKVWTWLSTHENEVMTNLRRENLAGLSGRVLEIGAGTGTNFALYPDTVEQVVAVEPEPSLLVHAKAAAAAAPVEVVVTGETAESIPEAGLFDAVVCSLVLCSVDDPDHVVRQLFSRLKPKGELRYMEHAASPGWRGNVQRAADATLWPRMFGNCHTHRNTEETITAAGFTIAGARHTLALPRWLPLPAVEFTLGRAVKPA